MIDDVLSTDNVTLETLFFLKIFSRLPDISSDKNQNLEGFVIYIYMHQSFLNLYYAYLLIVFILHQSCLY